MANTAHTNGKFNSIMCEQDQQNASLLFLRRRHLVRLQLLSPSSDVWYWNTND